MICPFCGKEVLSKDGFCEHCEGYVGKESTPYVKKEVKIEPKTMEEKIQIIKGEEKKNSEEEKAPLEEKKVCISCGATINKGDFYCPNCHKIVDADSFVPKPSGAGPMRCLAIFGFVLAFLYSLIGFILSVILLNFLPKDSKTNDRKYCEWAIFISFNTILATIIVVANISFFGGWEILTSIMGTSIPGFISLLCI